MTVHEAVDAEIVKPLGLDDMSIGAPPDQRDRVAQLLVRFGNASRAERYARRAARYARLRPIDAFTVPEADRLFASNEVLNAAIPAVNGCFTARSLARMYAALAGGGVLDGAAIAGQDRGKSRRCRKACVAIPRKKPRGGSDRADLRSYG